MQLVPLLHRLDFFQCVLLDFAQALAPPPTTVFSHKSLKISFLIIISVIASLFFFCGTSALAPLMTKSSEFLLTRDQFIFMSRSSTDLGFMNMALTASRYDMSRRIFPLSHGLPERLLLLLNPVTLGQAAQLAHALA